MDENKGKIKVILADDHKLMRDGLRALLEKPEHEIEIVAEADDGRVAVELVREIKPDVIVMDVAMPNLNGIEATRQIVTDFPQVAVLALSMHTDQVFITEMFKAGAKGYLLKDCAFEELFFAIRSVYDGRTFISPKIADVLIQSYVQDAAAGSDSAFTVLSAREREVLQLVAEGYSTKEIAQQLYLSEKTIESHRRRVMKKLDLRSVAELTKYAIKEGLINLDD